MTIPSLPAAGANWSAWAAALDTEARTIAGKATARGINLQDYVALKDAVTGSWSAAMTAALAAAASTGLNQIEIPDAAADYKFTAGIDIPDGMQVILHGYPILDFAPAGNVVAITLRNQSTLRGSGIIKGNGRTNTATGIKYIGRDPVTRGPIRVTDFGTGWSGVANLTYITTVDRVHFTKCGLDVDLQLSGTGFVSGEKILFRDCTFDGSDHFFSVTGSATEIIFDGCSFDHADVDYGDVSDAAQAFFTNCHFESNSTYPATYLFKKQTGGRMRFVNCNFMIFKTSTVWLIDPATEGTSGNVCYVNCISFFVATAGGAAKTCYSENQVFVAAGGTTATFDSVFISRTVLASVAIGLHNNNAARSVATPTVSFAASSTLATVTFGSALAANTVVIVRFG